MIFYGTIQNGLLELNDEESYHKFLTSLIGEVQVVVEKRKKQRSSGQNRYGYGVALKLLCDHTGYELEEMKQIVKRGAGLTKELWVGGRMFDVLRSTADLSTVEWEDFMAFLRRFGDSLGVYIPAPNEPAMSL